MVRFQLISDVHLTHHEDIDWSLIDFIDPLMETDVLLIAGDLGNPEMPHYREFLLQASRAFPTVLLVAGNHEFFGHSLNQSHTLIQKAIRDLPNVHYLNCSTFDISPTIRVLGCCLWSFVTPPARHVVSSYLSDYRTIFADEDHTKLITVDQLNEVHAQHVQWLTEELIKARAENKQVLVMTHHLPSYKLIDPKYSTSSSMKLLNTAFASDLDHLIASPVAIWVCGHTHTAKDMMINNVRVVINPCGYPHEPDTSDPTLVLTLNEPTEPTSTPELPA